ACYVLMPLACRSTLFPYTTLFRSRRDGAGSSGRVQAAGGRREGDNRRSVAEDVPGRGARRRDLVGWLSDGAAPTASHPRDPGSRSEEHTSELQSRGHLVCRLLLEK